MRNIFLILITLLFCQPVLAQMDRFNLTPATCVSDDDSPLNTDGTHVIVAGVADKSIVVYKIFLQNFSAVKTKVSVSQEDSGSFWVSQLDEGQPAIFSLGDKVYKLDEDKNLEFYLDVDASEIAYTVCYGLE